MELKIFRDDLPQAGAGCTVKAELPLETEILISDYLPPVFKLVKCFVRPVVLQKQLQPGRLNLDGYLRCTVYYQGEDGAGLCQTEQKLPFSKQLELPEFAFTAWAAQVEGQTEYINCRAVTPRRIEVRGAFGLVASIHTQNKTELITALSDGGVEQKLVTLSGVRRAANLEKLLTAEGTVRFAQPPAAILDISGTASVQEVKVLRGKAVVKGELDLACAWRAEGDTALQSTGATETLPAGAGCGGLGRGLPVSVHRGAGGLHAGGREKEAAGESTLTATAMLRLTAWRPYQLQCVADAFSTQYEASLTMQEIFTEALVCPLNETARLKGSGPLPDAGASILACFASFGPVQLVCAEKGGWTLTAKAFVTAFGENSLGELESYEKTLELALPVPGAEKLPPDADLYPECALCAEDLQCLCQNGALEVTLTARAEGAMLRRSGTPCLAAMELGEERAPADPEISLRIYYAQAGESLFEIARRFAVSPGKMREANDLPEGAETLSAPRRLLVPSG